MTRDELIGTYSDLWKDRHGFRPRWMGEWSVAELEAAIEALAALPPVDDGYECEWDDSGEVDHVTASQPTAGEGWAFVPAQ